MSRLRLRAFAALVLPLILLLSLAGVASAQWTVTNIVHSWDDGMQRWEPGNVQMYLDGSWQPMHHDFEGSGQDEFDSTGYPNSCPAATPAGTSSTFAGEAQFALDHTDNAPMGAQGFQSTDKWMIVDCAALQVGGPQDPDKKYATGSEILYTCTPDNNDGDIDTCEIVSKDVTSTLGCNDANCFDEIVTTVRVNFDNNCDGAMGEPYASAEALCLYWEAEKPEYPAAQYWQGNIQVHVDQGGGRKTVNFREPQGPLSVGMQEFSASATQPAPALPVMLGLALLGVAGLALAWRSARGSQTGGPG